MDTEFPVSQTVSETKKENGYEFFQKPEERQELIEICRGLVEYLHANKIKSLVLIDRSARPAYIGFFELWEKNYPDEKPPEVFFLNPLGFVSQEAGSKPGKHWGSIGEERAWLAAVRARGDKREKFGAEAKSESQIKEEISRHYKSLMSHKGEPLLLFDNCIHSGDSIRPLRKTLEKIGFQDVRIGVASTGGDYSGIKPDFVALKRKCLGRCYAFRPDTMVRKTFTSVSSKATEDPERKARAIRLRKEIKKIFDEAR